VNDVLRGAALARVPFVARGRVTAFLDDLETADPDERAHAEPIVQTLLSLALVAERFRPASAPRAFEARPEAT
jgi:hypothetical protein